MPPPRASDPEPLHTSVLLRELIEKAPHDHFTLGWLFNHLPKHSYGFILLFLAIIALLPVISVPARILIIILTGQIILGYHCPILPARLMKRQLPSKYLARLKRHAVPMLQHLEHIVRPRLPGVFEQHGFAHVMRRIIVFVVMLDTALSLPAPIPLANMPPAAVCILLALSYMEHDGLVFSIAAGTALAMLMLVGLAIAGPFI